MAWGGCCGGHGYECEEGEDGEFEVKRHCGGCSVRSAGTGGRLQVVGKRRIQPNGKWQKMARFVANE